MLRHLLTFVVLLVVSSGLSQAAWLENVPQTLRQPDGSVLHCLATGDEYNNWLHDAAGYTIIQHPSTGYYVYALLKNGNLVPSSYIAGRIDPAAAGVAPGLNITPERMLQRRQNAVSQSIDPLMQEATSAPKKGSFNNICVFIRFSDEAELTDLQSKYTTMFNSEAVGYNSLRLFFFEASYNQLGIMTYVFPAGAAGSTVVSYQDSHPRAYYQPYNATTNPLGYSATGTDERDREHTLLKAAVDFMAPLVTNPSDFDADGDGRIDNVCFIVSGSPNGWNSLLWPHRWSLYSQTAYIGTKRVYDYNLQLQSTVNTSVLCHEMSHSVGFPDLYHYVSDNMSPIGAWDLMAANRNPPQHQGAYAKMKYATWIVSIPSITTGGTYTLQPLTSSTNNAYKIASPNSSIEFFVLEYRKKQGTFESSVPGEGLVVYRINGAKTGQGNADGPPDEIYIYRPGGTLSKDGTLSAANYSNSVGRTMINDTTSPSDFLSDGSLGGLNISEIGEPGATLSFKVTMGGSNTIAFATNPTGLTLTVDGTTHATPYAAIWPDWSSHTIESTSPQEGRTGIQYLFSAWNDGQALSHQVTASSSALTYTADFQTQYMLTMIPGGGGQVNPSSEWHNSGESVNISAIPNVGCLFNGWTGSGSGSYTGSTNQVSVTMNAPMAETASFTQLGTAVDQLVGGVPLVTSLEQNWPNPFNPTTVIKYTVGVASGQGQVAGKAGDGGRGPALSRAEGSGVSKTSLVVYDELGRQVAILVNEVQAPGSRQVSFDASKLSSGVYYFRLNSGNFGQTRAMILMK